LGSGCHPAREIGFEGFLVLVAGDMLFADVFRDAVGEEIEGYCVQEAECSAAPDGVFGLLGLEYVYVREEGRGDVRNST
jgi:hypothetical protein